MSTNKRALIDVYETWTKTEKRTVKGKHVWTIDHFSQRVKDGKPGDVLWSSMFSVPEDETKMLSFQMTANLNGEKVKEDENPNTEEKLSLFFHNREKKPLQVSVDFSIMNSMGGKWGKQSFSQLIDRNCGYRSFCSKRTLEYFERTLLPNGNLTIICEFEVTLEDQTTQGKRLKTKFQEEDCPDLKDNIAKTFLNGSHSDVTLVCGKKNFPCHKIVLSARSDVFAAMFSHSNTSESLVISHSVNYAIKS